MAASRAVAESMLNDEGVVVAGWSCLCSTLAMTICILSTGPVVAQQSRRVDKNRSSQRSVLQQIPLDQLTLPAAKKIRDVVSRPSIHRVVPGRTIACSKDLYLQMVENPEIVVNIWQLMGITDLKLNRTAPFIYQATDGAGTSSEVELVYGTPELHLFYAQGSYVGKLLRHRLEGRCVVIVTSEYTTLHDRPQVKHQVEVFVRLDDVAADVLARPLTPLIGKLIDYNFRQSSGFIEQVYQAAEKKQAGMGRLINRMTHVEPAVKAEFARLVEEVKKPPAVAGSDDTALRR